MRPILLLIVLATLFTIYRSPSSVGTLDFLSTAPEEVNGRFDLCEDSFHAALCVVDGDTLALGERRIRVLGIDTAEKEAACEAEARLARMSTLMLQDWLNAGPFIMQAKIGIETDRYGRELRRLWRQTPSGSREYLDEFMRERGGARDYDGGSRAGWC
jgi:endonuclease YncB( thermonuclease family)